MATATYATEGHEVEEGLTDRAHLEAVPFATLRICAPRRVGLPYGSYPRLILAWLTTEAVRTKIPKIDLGPTPNDLARKLGLSTISGPRGTAHRLEDQVRRLLCTRLAWQTTVGLHPTSSGSGFVTTGGAARLKPLRLLLPRQPTWRSHIVLGQRFFEEITQSAVPVDLRAIRQLQPSPLALDLYVWLTYRMSYLTASVDYRLSEEAPYPAAIEDSRTAIQWLTAHADTYGIDPSRIALMGGSAGGHLAEYLK